MCYVAYGGNKKGSEMSVEKLSAKLVEKRQLTNSFWWFELEFAKKFKFEAGQYVSVKVDEKGNRRAYSIATPPGDKRVGLLVDVSPGGIGSKFFEKLVVGEEIGVLGPLGRFVVEKTNHTPGVRRRRNTTPGERSWVFVGTGSGIAPLKAMIEDLLPNKVNDRSCKLVWGMRYEKDVFWQDDFKALEKKYKNFKFDLVLSKGSESWQGRKGHVTDVLGEMENLKRIEFYLCGSSQMVEDCQKVLIDKVVDEKRIYFEKYG